MKLLYTLLPALIFLASIAVAGEATWTAIPKAQWQGTTEAQVPALKATAAAAIALPVDQAQDLTITSAVVVPAGLYEIRLTVRASHTHDAIAFHTRFGVNAGQAFPAHTFARVHQPETRTFSLLHGKKEPLKLTLSARADAKAVGKVRVKANLKAGGPAFGEFNEDEDLDLELDITLDPASAVYLLVDKVEFRPISRSGQITKVTTNKIRYLPGETLKGSATLVDVGGTGGKGTLELYLEHNVRDRVKVKSLPVMLKGTQTFDFELPLPKEELGYALVAAFVSTDGTDRSEAAEYFNIATQFARVAIVGGAGLATRDAVQDEASIRAGLNKARSEYVNATEYFAWAEDDMVEMSPDTPFWSSGQTNYRMHKETIQRQIHLAHELGIAVITYGKFVMSGFPGWQTAYDYPNDYRGQYNYHVGSYQGINVPTLDKLRDRDVRVYSKSPNVKGNAFHTWWAGPKWIDPDATPRAIRIAAEECVRSAEMFGWDMIRWDGHPRGGGHWIQCGKSGNYQAWAARQTQSLVRYFKAIVNEKHSNFGHGYNYLLIEKDKGYDWAIEDFELDELCRGGGLIMNESIGNASAGWTFEQIVRNLQVDGDLCRERGGFYQGISFGVGNPPRDIIIESALWAAAGARPYNTSMSRAVRRYCTRYSQYTFDERLRRLATPEKVLSPKGKTHLWWQPFVYETPLANGKRQLVVNLLNIPRNDTRPPRDGDIKPKYDMPKGTAATPFTLTLPEGMAATGVSLINPETLAVETLALKNRTFTVPPVSAWSVLVVDLSVQKGSASLASQYGPPKTLGVKRKALKEGQARRDEVVLDPTVEIWEVNKRMSSLTPDGEVKRAKERAELDALSKEERTKALLAKRPSVESLTKQWWKGGTIPADHALMEKRPSFGDLTPMRNGRFDIFYARGGMDYRLRLREGITGLGQISLHEARLGGMVQAAPHMWMADGISTDQLSEFDLLLYTGVPHAGIGVKQSYALVDYVKAGGAVFLTGGEFAFGKGGYMHTVLERELLPLRMVTMQDTVYTQTPQIIAPGPDFASLGADLDFTAKPSFYVRNEVVLKDGAKVFLESQGQPVLVGWELGKGRVVCLLLDHRGKSEDATLFFDWAHWPKLTAAVMTWLAPDAGKRMEPSPSKPATTALEKLLSASENAELGGLDDLDDMDDLDDLNTDQDSGLHLPGEAGNVGVELEPEDLKTRIKLIRQTLPAKGAELGKALASQLSSVANLPLNLRLEMLVALQESGMKDTGELGQTALKASSGALHGSGYALIALAGDTGFADVVASPPAVRIESPLMKRERLHDLALAIAVYRKGGLAERARKTVKALNDKEADVRKRFATILHGDDAMLETSPCLNGDDSLARIAWLTYLARQDMGTYGRAFIREWLKIDQYMEYCGRTSAFLVEQKSLSKRAAKNCREEWHRLRLRFAALKALTQEDADALVAKQPELAAEAMAAARFRTEALAAINLLGGAEATVRSTILPRLKDAKHQDLAAFARGHVE